MGGTCCAERAAPPSLVWQDEWDVGGGGSLDLKELTKILKAPRPPPKLKAAGAAAKLATK